MKDYCYSFATKEGVYDEIDEKVCLRDRTKAIESKLIKIMPELTTHAMNYEQCLAECEKNSISYVVANQSCRGVYDKNFQKASLNLMKRLENDQII